MKALTLILSIILLNACTSPAKTICRDWPDIPNKDARDVANYITDGKAAWKSCKLAATGVIK